MKSLSAPKYFNSGSSCLINYSAWHSWSIQADCRCIRLWSKGTQLTRTYFQGNQCNDCRDTAWIELIFWFQLIKEWKKIPSRPNWNKYNFYSPMKLCANNGYQLCRFYIFIYFTLTIATCGFWNGHIDSIPIPFVSGIWWSVM